MKLQDKILLVPVSLSTELDEVSKAIAKSGFDRLNLTTELFHRNQVSHSKCNFFLKKR